MPRREKTEPTYTRGIKTLADEFNEFFTTVGERASEPSKDLAVKYDLPVNCYQPMLQSISNIGDLFYFKYVSSSEIK